MQKEEKTKSRSPINPQGQESREKESQGWAEAKTGQVPKCQGSEKGQRTERPCVSDIRTGESRCSRKAALQVGRARLPCKRVSRVSKATMQQGRVRLPWKGEQGCPASWTSKATLQESKQGEQGCHAIGASKAALEGRFSQDPKGGTVGVMHVRNDEALLTMCIRE
jgi:hypothetical protein